MRGLQFAACLVSPLSGVGEQPACWPHRIGKPLKLVKTCSLFDSGNRGCAGHPRNDYGALARRLHGYQPCKSAVRGYP